MRRNPWLLLRLFMVVIFTFGASLTAGNLSYGLRGDPVELSVAQINRGEIPTSLEVGDYVRIKGTPDLGEDLDRIGSPESKIAVSERYSTTYLYFGLEETGDNLLIQTVESLPEPGSGSRTWEGKFATVDTVIFHDTTQRGLKRADLPRDGSIPVIETGDTPQYNRQLFPVYLAIIGIWLASLTWLAWKKNKPFLGV
jgi:hypothetical protein